MNFGALPLMPTRRATVVPLTCGMTHIASPPLAGFIRAEIVLARSCWVAGGYQLLVSLARGERLWHSAEATTYGTLLKQQFLAP